MTKNMYAIYLYKNIFGQTHIFMYVVPTFILCNINKEKHIALIKFYFLPANFWFDENSL